MTSPSSLDFYDAELLAHHEHLRAAYGIAPGDEVVFDAGGFDVAISRFGTMFFPFSLGDAEATAGVVLDSRSWLVTARRRR